MGNPIMTVHQDGKSFEGTVFHKGHIHIIKGRDIEYMKREMIRFLTEFHDLHEELELDLKFVNVTEKMK